MALQGFLEQPPAGTRQDNFGGAPDGYFKKTALVGYSFYLTLFLKMSLDILFFISQQDIRFP